ncbi:hypothetical protein QVD17_32299 [Tagetes erecta]|uniref:GUN4-like domain-containing protein n=1 Tax=Tagetes erecta TaxID=13708 RepID=A0AAD8NQ36_TARER|nr:hypothetical protein QVD17_32299 [Tagetes erecta]
MTTNSLQSLNYRHHTQPLARQRRVSLDAPPLSQQRRVSLDSPSLSRQRRVSIDSPPPTLPLYPNNGSSGSGSNNYNQNIYNSRGGKIFSLSASTTSVPAPAPAQSTTFDLLARLLSAKDFREADNETRRLLIALAGEGAEKRGYVFFSEVQFIPEADLKTIDNLWKNASNNKFGYSVQKKIWEKTEKDFTRFFIKVGWMKKLDTEVVQYNYRAFPDEFVWKLDQETPEGHLPLTNALRGTQLLSCILSHPAFASNDDEQETVVEQEEQERENKVTTTSGKGLFKTNYSF